MQTSLSNLPCQALRIARRIDRLERELDRFWTNPAQPSDRDECALVNAIETARTDLAEVAPRTLEGAAAQVCAAQRDLALGDGDSIRRANMLVRRAKAYFRTHSRLSDDLIRNLSLGD